MVSGAGSLADGVEVRPEVPVCQFHAFGPAGRARGVDETRQVVRVCLLEPLLVLLLVERLAAQLLNLAQRVDVLAVVGVGRLVDEHDHLQVEFVLDLEQRLEQLLVLDDDAAGSGVVQQILDLPGGGVGVHRGDDRPTREQREVGLCPLHAGVGVDADTVLALDTDRPEPGGEMADYLAHLAVCERGELARRCRLDVDAPVVHPALVPLCVRCEIAQRALFVQLWYRPPLFEVVLVLSLALEPVWLGECCHGIPCVPPR